MVVLHIALFINLGVQYLLAAHRTNPFCVCTGVTVLGILMHLLLANNALCISIRSPPGLLGEELVLVDLAAAALGGVAGPFLPLVRHYHLRQLLLTLLAHHLRFSVVPKFEALIRVEEEKKRGGIGVLLAVCRILGGVRFLLSPESLAFGFCLMRSQRGWGARFLS